MANHITSWTNGLANPFPLFDTAGADITEASGGTSDYSGRTNSLGLTIGSQYIVSVSLSGTGCDTVRLVTASTITGSNGSLSTDYLSAASHSFVFTAGVNDVYLRFVKDKTGGGTSIDAAAIFDLSPLVGYIPLLQIQGELYHQPGVFPLLQLRGELTGHAIHGTITIPSLSVIGRLNQSDTYAYANLSFSSIVGKGYGGGFLSERLQSVTLYAVGVVETLGKLDKRLPSISVNALGHVEVIGELQKNLPLINLFASGFISEIKGSLSKILPKIVLTAASIPVIIGRLSRPLKTIEIDALAYWQGTASFNLTAPVVKLVALGKLSNSEGITYVLNVRNTAFSSYKNFSYNSMGMLNGKFICAAGTGLYEISDPLTDEGSVIQWKVRGRQVDLAANILRWAWITGKISGDAVLTIEYSNGARYDYSVESISEEKSEMRVKFGKGLQADKAISRYFSFELSNENESILELDSFKIFGFKAASR